jgi:Protein of unknown function (DUF1579)
MAGGFFLKSEGELNFNGSRIQSLEIIAYDPERKTFPSSVYSSMLGTVFSYVWDVQGITVILSGGWRPDEGTESTDETAYDATMRRVDDRK